LYYLLRWLPQIATEARECDDGCRIDFVRSGGFCSVAPIDIDLLLLSIADVLAAPQRVLRGYYAHLERLDPRLRYLLPAALPRYMRFALFKLQRTRTLVLDARGMGRLGKRLCSAGFDWPDVDTLVAAWLATLEEVLGERFGSDVREEWVRLYRALRSDSPGQIEPL
jgi:hypothetical protein